MPELMNTHEVAEYLRIKERKVYDLVSQQMIPCTRVTGKWLFPKHLIDAWLAEGTTLPELSGASAMTAPLVVGGSHDPLLDWTVRESGCGLALKASGSLDGLRGFADGEAAVCALHILEGETGEYNVPAVRGLGLSDIVLVEWARREQGLIVNAENPLGISGIGDLKSSGARIILRQESAGSHILLNFLLGQAGLTAKDLKTLDRPALTETDLGQTIANGNADAGLGVRAAARPFKLKFIPLHVERCDLLMRRRDYFEAPVQKLMEFARTPAFSMQAEEMGGYDVSGVGRVVWNGS
jgi:putative molybdopterin biosynthesis protein